jgi:hypothetical protein
MFSHPRLARQRHRDLIAAAETSRFAPAARTRRKTRPRPQRATHLGRASFFPDCGSFRVFTGKDGISY